MAVTKRVRYEVLRRDDHRCRYCGAGAPDVTLTMDHVLPVALGGDDLPTNLVTACRDCNSGKTSTAPDAELVKDVDQKALQWAAAMNRAAEAMVAEARSSRAMFDRFETTWIGRGLGPLPDDWAASVAGFRSAGLPEELIFDSMDISARKQLGAHGRFKYFAGVCWARIRELQNRSRESLGSDAAAPQTCGHCDTCRLRRVDDEDQTTCDVIYELDEDEQPYTCCRCGRPDCYYEIGLNAGMEYEWRRNYDAIKHYRDCPEVHHGS